MRVPVIYSELRTARVDAEDADVFSLQLLGQQLGEHCSSSVGLPIPGARVIIFAVLLKYEKSILGTLQYAYWMMKMEEQTL